MSGNAYGTNSYGTNAYGSAANANSDPYDYDYQPFGAKGGQSLADPFPTNTQYDNFSSTQFQDDEDVRLKQMELQRREEELLRREREIQMKEGVISDIKKKNWPICKPFLYHNIKEEIQPGLKRNTAYIGYIAWIALSVMFVVNLAISITTIVLPVDKDNGITDNLGRVKFVLFAAIMSAVGPVAHFAICYWPLYKALSMLTIGRFTLFFFGYAVAILYGMFCISGWYDYGMCGILLAIMYFPRGDVGNAAAFGLNLGMAVIWTIFTLIFIIVYIICIKIARSENHTFAKAVQYTKGAVVSTAGSFATQAVVSSATSQNEV